MGGRREGEAGRRGRREGEGGRHEAGGRGRREGDRGGGEEGELGREMWEKQGGESEWRDGENNRNGALDFQEKIEMGWSVILYAWCDSDSNISLPHSIPFNFTTCASSSLPVVIPNFWQLRYTYTGL